MIATMRIGVTNVTILSAIVALSSISELTSQSIIYDKIAHRYSRKSATKAEPRILGLFKLPFPLNPFNLRLSRRKKSRRNIPKIPPFHPGSTNPSLNYPNQYQTDYGPTGNPYGGSPHRPLGYPPENGQASGSSSHKYRTVHNRPYEPLRTNYNGYGASDYHSGSYQENQGHRFNHQISPQNSGAANQPNQPQQIPSNQFSHSVYDRPLQPNNLQPSYSGGNYKPFLNNPQKLPDQSLGYRNPMRNHMNPHTQYQHFYPQSNQIPSPRRPPSSPNPPPPPRAPPTPSFSTHYNSDVGFGGSHNTIHTHFNPNSAPTNVGQQPYLRQQNPTHNPTYHNPLPYYGNLPANPKSPNQVGGNEYIPNDSKQIYANFPPNKQSGIPPYSGNYPNNVGTLQIPPYSSNKYPVTNTNHYYAPPNQSTNSFKYQNSLVSPSETNRPAVSGGSSYPHLPSYTPQSRSPATRYSTQTQNFQNNYNAKVEPVSVSNNFYSNNLSPQYPIANSNYHLPHPSPGSNSVSQPPYRPDVNIQESKYMRTQNGVNSNNFELQQNVNPDFKLSLSQNPRNNPQKDQSLQNTPDYPSNNIDFHQQSLSDDVPLLDSGSQGADDSIGYPPPFNYPSVGSLHSENQEIPLGSTSDETTPNSYSHGEPNNFEDSLTYEASNLHRVEERHKSTTSLNLSNNHEVIQSYPSSIPLSSDQQFEQGDISNEEVEDQPDNFSSENNQLWNNSQLKDLRHSSYLSYIAPPPDETSSLIPNTNNSFRNDSKRSSTTNLTSEFIEPELFSISFTKQSTDQDIGFTEASSQSANELPLSSKHNFAPEEI